MAVMMITGRLMKKPEIKRTPYGELLKISLKEKNKYFSSSKKYPYYNYYTCVVYDKQIIKNSEHLEKYDIVSIVCDVVPKKKEGVRYTDLIVINLDVIQINAMRSDNFTVPDNVIDESIDYDIDEEGN